MQPDMTPPQPPNGCLGCLSTGTKTDDILTAIVNLTTAVDSMHTTVSAVVEGLNAVGVQNNWITENANRVFSAFEEMRTQFAKGGIMSMVKGMSSGNG